MPTTLARLREIGWSEWDPIGLSEFEGGWREQSFANEYDEYLLRVAAGLRQGWSVEMAASYLMRIETDEMCLSGRDNARAKATAQAIDELLKSRL